MIRLIRRLWIKHQIRLLQSNITYLDNEIALYPRRRGAWARALADYRTDLNLLDLNRKKPMMNYVGGPVRQSKASKNT